MRPAMSILLSCASLYMLCTTTSLVTAEAQHPPARLASGFERTFHGIQDAKAHRRRHIHGPLDRAFRKLIAGYTGREQQQGWNVAPVHARSRSPLAMTGADDQTHLTHDSIAAPVVGSVKIKSRDVEACRSKRAQKSHSDSAASTTEDVNSDDYPSTAVDGPTNKTDDHRAAQSNDHNQRGAAHHHSHRNTTSKLDGGYVQDSYAHSSSGPQVHSCFPALAFQMPDHLPPSLQHWWCSPSTEHAFLGFSYQVESCPSRAQLACDFRRMRKDFNARYVRMYGGCDSPSFNDDMIEAAWETGMGIYPLIWFGFDGDDKWKSRKSALMQAIKSNPKAPFVVRGVVVGSEPLFDTVLPVDELVNQIEEVKEELQPYTNEDSHGDSAMQVTLSDMSYSFQQFDGASKTLKAATILQANVLPFFSFSAKYGNSADALAGIKNTFSYLKDHSDGNKKVIFAQTGWPSTDEVWKANSQTAVASVDSEAAYFRLLDTAACHDPMLKNGPQGGLAWFAHIWSDRGLPGWGVLDINGKVKFPFRPRTSCH